MKKALTKTLGTAAEVGEFSDDGYSHHYTSEDEAEEAALRAEAARKALVCKEHGPGCSGCARCEQDNRKALIKSRTFKQIEEAAFPLL